MVESGGFEPQWMCISTSARAIKMLYCPYALAPICPESVIIHSGHYPDVSITSHKISNIWLAFSHLLVDASSVSLLAFVRLTAVHVLGLRASAFRTSPHVFFSAPRGSRTLKTRILSPVHMPILLPGHVSILLFMQDTLKGCAQDILKLFQS